MDPVLADLIANLARESSSALSWSEEEKHNEIGARAAHRVGEMVLCDDIRHSNVRSEDEGVRGVASVAVPSLFPVLTVYFQKWANAGRCWAAD